ncbi:MAG: hypothetical protein KBT36_01265 [Kurthia sp.]|nr:hypothetical protein [Candidatus Kurthia equi]
MRTENEGDVRELMRQRELKKQGKYIAFDKAKKGRGWKYLFVIILLVVAAYISYRYFV